MGGTISSELIGTITDSLFTSAISVNSALHKELDIKGNSLILQANTLSGSILILTMSWFVGSTFLLDSPSYHTTSTL